MLVLAVGSACSVTLDPTSTSPNSASSGGSGAAPSSGGGNAGGASGAPTSGEPHPGCVALSETSVVLVVCPVALSHAAASTDCEAQGGHLASIRSLADNAALVANASSAETTNLWLGGKRDEAHFWSWPDGTTFWHGRFDGAAPEGVFTNFLAGEPNNTSSTTGGAEACLAISGSTGGWNDRACDLVLSYVCELP